MELKFYNTLTRQKDVFKPIVAGKVGIYCCGPTVYFFAHIGNLRTYVFEDILKRVLLYNGFKVNHVMNITDVGHLTDDADDGEDKVEREAKKEGKTVHEIAEFYTNAFFKDTDRLNILRPDITCKATDHISDMIGMIKLNEQNGHTYIADGNVYYDISTFPDYGKMAKLKLENLKAGARVDVDEGKRNPQDFVLWFVKSKFKDHIMQWDSPWGTGYPGWHIECSAMSSKYLGEQVDIHCGGIDHIPIHHTNEIAQSEGAFGKKWVNYWLHGEFLVINQGRMGKSEGNFITLQTAIEKGFDPLDYRYFLLGAHYKTQLSFSWEALEGAKNAFSGLKSRIIELKKDLGESKGDIGKIKEEFHAYINDDMDMPKALALLWNVVKSDELGNKEKYALILDFDKIFGLRLDEVEEEKFDTPAEVEELLKKREDVRKSKDWAAADKYRDEIKEKGFVISDTAEGPKLKKA